jgi:acetyl esterase/lipase
VSASISLKMKQTKAIESKLAANLTDQFKVVVDYIWAFICTPWILSHFTIDILLCLTPWTRPTSKWTLNQAVRMRVVRLVLLYWSLVRYYDRLHLQPGRERNRFQVVRPSSPKLYKGALSDGLVRPEIIGMTWTPARPPPPTLVRSDLTVALHFHGGGFAIGNGRDEDIGYLAKTLLRHMGVTHVCTPQYRLSSAGLDCRFPAPVQDGLTAYLSLIQDMGIPARQIIVSGDSAGANLALGLLRYIHDHGEELNISFPGAVTLWSPWVDVHAALDQDMRSSPNYRTDYLSKEFGRWGAASVSGYLTVDPTGPYVSPLHHPFKLDIPMFVHGGEREVICPDVERFAQVYREHGCNTHLVISKNCPHDIILIGDRIGFAEEAEAAARDARRFLLSTNTALNLRGADDD